MAPRLPGPSDKQKQKKGASLGANAAGAVRSPGLCGRLLAPAPQRPLELQLSAGEQGLCGGSDDGSSLKQTQGGAEHRF